ncbi:hypothetical protein PTSG_06252 [Salpingoeca rosetta]|uniref:MACPF domain-containing protein n=1 Tax=Salpingoeca rosetta (strain ATCC 50818 / BSB-021) TaxID=946362 RepID=F2UCD5_SALR5|nr:uncharacterized protein PTSG_06252 [Salpingoeca rosetta]EGD74242.1 hypothetical protein PTSG_06252 [Salpingoeca rosetta]|eukprot:XP_004993142.1 hypothetical protein PTSG_06252 [Salpingoeca rosetta]
MFKGGVDLTAVELNALPEASIRADILDWTCSQGNTYNDYDVPDQIVGLRPIPSSECSIASWSESFLFKAFEHLSLDFSENYFFGLLSTSNTFSESMSAMVSSNAHVGVAACSVTTFEVILAPAWMLTPGENLLINMFGTGFLSNGTVGGVAQYFFASENIVTDFMAEGDIAASAKATLFNLVSAAGGASGHMDVNAHFNETLAFSFSRAFGGDVSPFGKQQQWQTWEKSVFDHPSVVQVQTQNLSSLVLQWHEDCGQQLALAEQNYNLRAFLGSQVTQLLQLISKYLTSQQWPTCEFGPNSTHCLPHNLVNQSSALQSNIKHVLSSKPVTPLGTAFLIAAEVIRLVKQVPYPAPKRTHSQWKSQHSGAISNAAFCGLAQAQVGFDTSVGNQGISIAPATWGASGGYTRWNYNSGSNYGFGATNCITYTSAQDMAVGDSDYNVTVIDTHSASTLQLGAYWLCVPATFQSGFDSIVGDADLSVTVDGNGVWTYQQHGHKPDMSTVICAKHSMPNVPENVVQYTSVHDGQVVDKHFVCWLGGLHYGHNSNIGNQFAAIQQNKDGTWTYTNTQHEPATITCVG